jgi:hypothetical protein
MKKSGYAFSLVLALSVLVLLTACELPKKSRFDDVAGVDVCTLITAAEAEHILGPVESAERGTNSGQGFAGECTWSFKALATGSKGTLYAMMTTRASSPHGMSPGQFFDVSQPEIEASLGATPWRMEGIGDKAFLYQTRRPDHSELWLLQSETLFIMRMMGGSSAQLEEFARAMSRVLEPQK